MIQSSEAIFFSIEFLVNISVFEISHRFAFHQSWLADVQSILEFLRLICDSLLSMYFPLLLLLLEFVPEWLQLFNLVPLLRIRQQVEFFRVLCNLGCCGFNYQTLKSDYRINKLKLRLPAFSNFYEAWVYPKNWNLSAFFEIV